MFDWLEWLRSAHMHSEHVEKGMFVSGREKNLEPGVRDNCLHLQECSQLYLEVAQITLWEYMRPKWSQCRALQRIMTVYSGLHFYLQMRPP